MLQERPDELRGDTKKNEKTKDQLACETASEQYLEPGAEQSLECDIHCDEQNGDKGHGGPDSWVGYASADRDCQQPTCKSKRGNIRETLGKRDEKKRSEAHGETQERAELEADAKPGDEEWKKLPKQKDAPEQQGHPLGVAGGNGGVGASVKSKADADDEDASSNGGSEQANQV